MWPMNFTKICVWQAAIQFAADIDDLTDKFPADERFRLVYQLRKSALSIHSNIAEGMRKATAADRAKHLNYSQASITEIQSQLKHCKLRRLYAHECELLIRRSIGTARMLFSLRRTVLRNGDQAR